MGIKENIRKSPFLLTAGWLLISILVSVLTIMISLAIKLSIWISPLLIMLGLLLIVIGVTYRYLAFKQLVPLNKNIAPDYVPEHFTTDGIYRWSRNPAYVGLIFMLIGSFLLAVNLLMAIVIIGGFIWLNSKINNEEKILTQKFGKPYIEYKNKTPRWI